MNFLKRLVKALTGIGIIIISIGYYATEYGFFNDAEEGHWLIIPMAAGLIFTIIQTIPAKEEMDHR